MIVSGGDNTAIGWHDDDDADVDDDDDDSFAFHMTVNLIVCTCM